MYIYRYIFMYLHHLVSMDLAGIPEEKADRPQLALGLLGSALHNAVPAGETRGQQHMQLKTMGFQMINIDE